MNDYPYLYWLIAPIIGYLVFGGICAMLYTLFTPPKSPRDHPSNPPRQKGE